MKAARPVFFQYVFIDEDSPPPIARMIHLVEVDNPDQVGSVRTLCGADATFRRNDIIFREGRSLFQCGECWVHAYGTDTAAAEAKKAGRPAKDPAPKRRATPRAPQRTPPTGDAALLEGGLSPQPAAARQRQPRG